MQKIILLMILVSSCASKKEVVQGHDGKDLEQRLSKIQGKTPSEAVKVMGQPAINGLCRKCGPSGIYRIIYLQKDMTRFYLGITYNTDANVDCIVLDFMPDVKLKKYIFDRATGFQKAKNCNQRDGAIMKLQQILDEQFAEK